EATSSSAFSISAGQAIELNNIRILGHDPADSAVFNHGNLLLKDVEILQMNTAFPGLKNFGFLQVSGFCKIK
ncbi:MAG: hypothetical protein SGI74_04920, partial [Oligoflexia bacterium]|nr:hypothetical protein [Oligoflexia bacterium]